MENIKHIIASETSSKCSRICWMSSYLSLSDNFKKIVMEASIRYNDKADFKAL